MFRLSDFSASPLQDSSFSRTQFANTTQLDSLCFANSARYLKVAQDNPAVTAVVTTPALAPQWNCEKGLVTSNTPEEDFYRLHNCLVRDHAMRPPLTPGIATSAQIHPSAIVDPYSEVGPDVEIAAGAVVMAGSVLGTGSVIGPNAVIGADGHFFKRYQGQLFNVLHAGGVRLGAGAHVLAGAVVSKSLHPDFTEIGAQSVVSIKSHVGHGCVIGERTIIAGAAQISGYTRIGDDGWIGPGATVGNLLKIGNNIRIEAGSVVVEGLTDDARVSGNYAVRHATNMMEFARKRRGNKT